MKDEEKDREPSIEELCKPLSATVMPKAMITPRLGVEPTEAQKRQYIRQMTRGTWRRKAR